MQESPASDVSDRLGALTARGLVIAGAHEMVPPERVQEIADGIPGAEFLIFEESGHFSPLEERESIAAAVFSFLGVE